MKKILNYLLKVFAILLFVGISHSVTAQPSDPFGGGSNTQSNKLGGNGSSAPIGGGVFILLGLTAAYGGRKLYSLKSEEDTEE